MEILHLTLMTFYDHIKQALSILILGLMVYGLYVLTSPEKLAEFNARYDKAIQNIK